MRISDWSSDVCSSDLAPRVLLIRGARVFDCTGAPARKADVLVRGERIVEVGPRLKAPYGSRVVNARGETLLPGLHDLHAHLRSPGYDAPEDLGKAYAGYLMQGLKIGRASCRERVCP